MLYQRKLVPSMVEVGEPAALPSELQGLADADLADLRWTDQALGYHGHGFFPATDAGRWVHKAIFKRRFTQAERIAIRLAETSEEVPDEARAALIDFRDILDSTERVYLDDPDLIDGLAFLVSLGLLQSGRPAEIRV